MAYHEVAMWEILSVLERLRRRESKTAITRATGRSRSTVRRYERLAREIGWTPDGDTPTEALAAEVGRLPHPAADRDPFGARGRVSVRMASVAPGEVAEIDFGRLGLVHDPVTNRRRTAWALVVLLPACRHQYVHVTFPRAQ